MSEPKTKKNNASVTDFINAIDDEQKKTDAHQLVQIMSEIVGSPAEMWGSSIVGFGKYSYKYESGREGDWMLVGFSPRKQALTLYIMSGFEDETDKRVSGYLEKLGTYKTGKACLYVKKLTDIDVDVLKKIIAESVAHMRKTNPS